MTYSPVGVNIRAVQLDDTLIALADETRRKILRRLASGEARVTEVAAPFDISLNSVSKHIRLLERAGLVRRRVAGRDHFLSLEPKPFDELTQWMERTREFWSGEGLGLRDLVCLGIRSGIGSGIIVDGKLLRGANDLAGLAGP